MMSFKEYKGMDVPVLDTAAIDAMASKAVAHKQVATSATVIPFRQHFVALGAGLAIAAAVLLAVVVQSPTQVPATLAQADEDLFFEAAWVETLDMMDIAVMDGATEEEFFIEEPDPLLDDILDDVWGMNT